MTPGRLDFTMANPPLSAGMVNTPRHTRSRTQSISSDRPSTISHSLMSPPLAVSPEAAFIAASAASQIVTTDHDSHSETWYDQMGIEPSGETALVSPGALQLANNFVDQLLFNIISIAKSTSLGALRPAVSEVLKPKLAKDAMNQADEELREYLGGGEVEDLVQSPGTEFSRDWDLELAWKRTRLRCMVYSSLGDMEEEDEDYYMEQEHLAGDSDDILSESVSPAVAIFLTSILEFMGEQVLVVSGQAAFNRLRVRYEKELKEGIRAPGELSDRIVVEELDMERVALDRTLGRLWRSWKKRIRSPTEPNYSRPFSHGSIASGLHSRQGSVTTDYIPPNATAKAITGDEQAVEDSHADNTKQDLEEQRPSAIPLPIGDNDVAEIEVPGLVSYSDDEDSENEQEVDLMPRRPKSLIYPTRSINDDDPADVTGDPKSFLGHRGARARSQPPPTRLPFLSPSRPAPQKAAEDDHEDSQEEEYLEAAEDNAHIETDKADPDVTKDSKNRPDTFRRGTSKRISLILSGAAVGGDAPGLDSEDSEVEEFAEEPEIMTSSRVSVGGRSSPATSERGRPPSIVHVRSGSAQSTRLVKFQPPHSPRAGSVEGFDSSPPTRSANISREGSTHASGPATTIPEQNDWAPVDRGFKRNAMMVASPDVRGEINDAMVPSPRSHTPPKQQATPTRVTVLRSPSPEDSIAEDDERQDIVQNLPSMRNPPLPTLPERSASRQVYGQNNNMPAAAAHRSSPESPKYPRAIQAESPSGKLKPVRTSEDSGSHRAGDVARNFEELIHSDQTLQYTLTPENMRDMNSSRAMGDGSPVTSHRARRSEDAKMVERSRSSSLKRTLSVSKATSLASHPPSDVSQNGGYIGSSSKTPMSMSTKARSGSLARDARVPRESTQEFADFIRSTGPMGEPSPPKRVGTGGATATQSTNGIAPAVKSASMESRRTGGSSAGRTRLQARDATVTSANESSELIDFIRRGPPNQGNNPRIPRHVAPFRSTMDSDQMQMSGATGGKAVDAIIPNFRDSQASTNFTETSAPSSMNSQSALLKANKPTAMPGSGFDDNDMMPKRKQRRVRDPYAIDFSDEDDDLDLAPKPKPKQEESLIDFLNNYQPPPEPTPQPPAQAPQAPPKKKASAPNLIARLRSNGRSSTNGGSAPVVSRNVPNAPESRSLSSRASNSKGYTPINVEIPPGANTFGNDFMSSNTRMNPNMRANPSGRVPMKKFEPREAVSSKTQTADLASFLRDSEPPPSTLASLPSPPKDKANSGFSRMFERRKKSTAF